MSKNQQYKASLGYRNIARRILGESEPLMAIEDEHRGMFSKLKAPTLPSIPPSETFRFSSSTKSAYEH